MGQVLVLTTPARGHMFPALAIVAELVRRGHEVTCVTVKEFADNVLGAGAEVLLYDSVGPLAIVGAEDSDRAPIVFLEENIAVLQAAEAAFGDRRPDIVVYDGVMNRAGQVLASIWKKPGVDLTPVFASNEHYSFMDHTLELAGLTGVVNPAFQEYGERLADLLTEYHIDVPVEKFVTQNEDLTILYVPREFQPKGETFDERFAFVGPSLGERAFLGEWEPPTSGLPVVLASLGTTYNNNAEFFRSCVQAFTDQPWHVVISIGEKLDPADLGPVPPNVELRRWVPHLKLLEHAKVFITHGGMGSVMESVYSGRPMVLVPSWPDVLASGLRAAELGLGKLVRPQDATADVLRAAVVEVAADAAMHRRVQQMQQSIREAGGAPRAAELIEAHAQRGT